MVFDIKNLANDKKEKIAIGALKYIAIKESFKLNMPLYENELFRKYFTDFYKLTRGAFSTPMMQEAFYRLFQSICELYDKKYYKCESFKNIATIISSIAGDNEKSFSSKILHTLDNNSPIIDSNVLKGLTLQSSPEPYKDLCNEYLYGNKIKGIFANKLSQTNSGGLIAIAKAEKWDGAFWMLCCEEYQKIIFASLKDISYSKRQTIKKARNELVDIVKDIFKIHYLKTCTSAIDRLEKEIEIEKFFKENEFEKKVFEDKENFGINIKKQLEDISLVKKIDFYLWAYFA